MDSVETVLLCESDMDAEKSGMDVDLWPLKKSEKKPVETKPLEPFFSFEDIDDYLMSDVDRYYMKYPKNGKCYIFNHRVFHKLDERKGTDRDAKRLYFQFRRLGFQVHRFNNFKARDVMTKLKEVEKEDHSSNSYFVCVILTYGENGYLHARDGKYRIGNIFTPFWPGFCPTLDDKPKMFFIQACPVGVTHPDVKVICSEYIDPKMGFNFPPDGFMMYSAVPGRCAVGNTSWFVQSLCDVLEEYAETEDLYSMSLAVNRRVASYNPENDQVPVSYSTMIRHVKFL